VGSDRAALGNCIVNALGELVDVELGPTAWREVAQERIDAFAAATDDPQWIHTDPVRAATGPFGTTIAHGFLTLSLCVPMLDEVLPAATGGMVVNYGVDRVRFPAAVPAGSMIRGRFRVISVEDTAQGERRVIEATIECDGVEKPVCVAQLVVLVS
jgi:acyl dehydratase